MAAKFYVIWAGHQTGIFTDWPSCKRNVDKFPGARYKSFKTRAEAEAAFADQATVSRHTGDDSNNKTSKRKHKKGLKTYSAAEIAECDAEYLLFTDGGCDPNPGKAGSGLAVYYKHDLQELWFGLFNPQGTNNTAELNALHQAIIKAADLIAQNNTVAIFCDSQYAIQCVDTWAVNWQKNNWKKAGGEIKNLAIIQPMFTLYQRVKDRLTLHHVNGHVGVEGNELADRMSMLAIKQREKCFTRYSDTHDIAKILAMQAG